MKKDGFVYFIKPVNYPGPIKIGFSRHPAKRLNGLLLWTPFQLEILHTVPGDRKLEMKIHSHFADLHDHHEWFHPGERLLNAIEAMQGGKSVEESVDLTDLKGRINGRPNWTPEQRSRLSYVSRVRWALAKHQQKNRRQHYRLPNDVQEIVSWWVAQAGLSCPFASPQQYARLDEFLADPTSQIVVDDKAAA